jgi:hypothetical protein
MTMEARGERRKSKRRKVLEAFSIFIMVPKKGYHQLKIRDISESGIGFDLDIEGETPLQYPAQVGDTIDFRFYINHSLSFPLSTKIVRITEKELGRHVGTEFQDKQSPSYQALVALLYFLDSVIDVIQIDP